MNPDRFTIKSQEAIAAARRLAEEARRAHAVTVPRAGHAAHLERPNVVAALLGDFLDHYLGEGLVVDGDA